MRDNEKRPGRDTRANPEPNALHNACTDFTSSGAPPFVLRAWCRWNAVVDQTLAIESAPVCPLAETAAASIHAEWNTDEGGAE